MASVLLALLVGFVIGGVLVALIAAEVLLRLLPRLELHGLRPMLALMRHEVLRLRRPDERTLRRRIARALRSERVTAPSGRTYAAQSIVVWLAEPDLRRIAARMPLDLLQEELALHYGDVADAQGWIRSGGETVALHAKPDLTEGAFDIESRVGSTSPAPAPTVQQPMQVETVLYGDDGPDPASIVTERMRHDSCSATLTYRGRTRTVFADEPPTLMGRGPQASFRLEEEGVSRRHATLDHDDGVWTLRPSADARNGTFVDGVRTTGPYVLRGRRFIRLGQVSATEFASDCAHTLRG